MPPPSPVRGSNNYKSRYWRWSSLSNNFRRMSLGSNNVSCFYHNRFFLSRIIPLSYYWNSRTCHFLSLTVLLTNHNYVSSLNRCWLAVTTTNNDFSLTSGKRITSIAFRTWTDRSVVLDPAVSTGSTCSWLTWITTVVVEACKMWGTLSVILTFSLLTGSVGVSLIACWAPACCCISYGTTLSI